MSQVKNLRAMFEQNKQDASPPDKAAGSDRGRSPVGSAGTSTPPPRPLSKVRTSFVAVVEKDGRMGLRRDPSSDSIPTTRSLSQRRLSTNTEEGSISAISDKMASMTLASEPIPESPRQADFKAPTKTPNGTNEDASKLGALTDKPSNNPDKHVDLETPTPKLLPGDPTADVPSTQPLGPAKASTTNNATATPKATAKTAAAQGTPKSTTKHSSKLQPVSISKPAGKPPAKSPSLPKTPTGGLPKSASQPLPTRSHPPKKTTERTAASKASTATAAKSTTTKPTASTAAKKPTPAPVSLPSSSSTGFVKPKVKSPTRPVNLPSSLMAGTASSQSKTKDGGRDSLGPRGSGISRSPSRVSVSTQNAGPTKTIRRQKSTINHPRPSIGPPPKKAAQDHPVAKKEKEVDEGFLARMARPTLSSASKVNEKAPVTPPRVHAPKKETSTTRASSTATSTRRPAPHSAHAATGSPGSKKKPTSVMGASDEVVEPSKIEEVEVEEALRNATEIPEVEEPVEALHVAAEVPGVEEQVEETTPAPAVEAAKIEQEAPAEVLAEPEVEPEAEAEAEADAAPVDEKGAETTGLLSVAEEAKEVEVIPAAEEAEAVAEETVSKTEAEPLAEEPSAEKKEAEEAADVLPTTGTSEPLMDTEASVETKEDKKDAALTETESKPAEDVSATAQAETTEAKEESQPKSP